MPAASANSGNTPTMAGKREDVGFGFGAADEDEARRRTDQNERNEQDEPNAAAAGHLGQSIGTRTLSSSSCCVMIGMDGYVPLVLSARP